MKKHYLLLTILFLLTGFFSYSQKQEKDLPFSIRLEEEEVNNMPSLQSFAQASYNGKWLLLAGRIDGLHRRQPWASFDELGQNKFLYVVDPIKKKVWKKSIESLPTTIAEQLQSTNAEFYQIDSKLLLVGGYGYSKIVDEHITFPFLIVIQLNELINAIVNNTDITKAITQIKDERMAVTGGRMAKLGDTILLVGGQRFDGRYNPHGPDHGPGFKQQYTNEIRKFELKYENGIPQIFNYRAIKDTINLHRRDYNLVPQIFPNDELGYTIYAGVFQYNQDLPYTSFVDIYKGGYQVNNDFQQKLSHYHSAVLPIYDKKRNALFTIFFGGIAQYYPDSNGKLINNKEVPFTKTISIISKINGKVEESYLPIKMPGYLGAAAEFIFAENAKLYNEGIANLDIQSKEETLIGYIVGGINSSDKNIFFSNSGKESNASKSIIKVYLKVK